MWVGFWRIGGILWGREGGKVIVGLRVGCDLRIVGMVVGGCFKKDKVGRWGWNGRWGIEKRFLSVCLVFFCL